MWSPGCRATPAAQALLSAFSSASSSCASPRASCARCCSTPTRPTSARCAAPCAAHCTRKLRAHPPAPQIGFLYLRYVGEPRSLWEWFQEFLRDSEEFAPASDGKTVSLGLYCRELLLDQFYFETLFPRIPEVMSRQIKEGLARLGFATAAVGGAGTGASRRGSQAADEGPSRRPPSVKAALSVSLGQRAPHVAHVREAGRGYANVEPGGKERARSPARQPEARDRERDRERDRDRERSRERRRERERERSRSRSPGRDDHSKHRRHHRSRSRERRRERSRSRSRGRDARDVFRARPAPAVDPSTLKDRY